MATCSACGKQGIRKTQVAFVIEGGRVRGRRVGECCAGDGVLIVNGKKPRGVESGKAERRGQQEVLAPFIRLFEGQLRAKRAGQTEDEFESGTIAALEGVVSVLKSGRS